jgi:hypothetical protein
VAPKALKIVVVPGFLYENVKDEIAVVHQNPLGAVITLDAERQLARSLHSKMNLVTDGLILANVRAGTNKEIIGEAGDFAKV